MSKQEIEKIDDLKKSGNLNPNASDVKDELFIRNDFFDPRDMIQVKYEMLRKVRKEDCSVKEAIYLFGLSRPYYYKMKHAFDQKGITGLLPKKRGPKGGYKLRDEIVKFIETIVGEDPTMMNYQIAQKIKDRFQLMIHPRTIGRVRKGQKKSRRKK